ncbi:Fic family protein [Candidatus Micrarchaeota archaeon]|nr:Fic family protein [Candidatus Micrarchaeota archaeon]
MRIIQRKVKGKPYFYLEKTLRIGDNKWKKIYVYLGLKKPRPGQAKTLQKKLDQKVSDYILKEIVKPDTEFIDKDTALKLERIKNTYAKLLDGLGKTNRAALLERQRAQFITNTNAIEGSRITLDQTKKILELRKTYETDKDELEVLNMRDCLALYDKYLESKEDITESMVLRMHLILLKAIPGYEEHEGAWRKVNVFIRTSKYEFPHWQKAPGLMKQLFKWYAVNRQNMHPLELAAKFHARLVTIHPFADGNGRMARLLMNYILQANRFPFIDIPYDKRDEYFDTQEKAHFGNFRPFVDFLIKQMIEDYKKSKKA